ncbi:MAG: hypothetical protein KC944_17585 [Candidatus Omnitrophica bacterium]|nr:hypothetical protein [Candidatus Omnitrophota bacterium]
MSRLSRLERMTDSTRGASPIISSPEIFLIVSLVSMVAIVSSIAGAPGPLTVHPVNPRYFSDGTGKAVYLTGSHVWNNFVDWGVGDPPPEFDHEAFIAWLKEKNHNFVRGWVWENTRFKETSQVTSDWRNAPIPWARSDQPGAHDGGNKFDLTEISQDYLDRVRERCIAYGENGIYVGVMLFQPINYGKKRGARLREEEYDWWCHPFHETNNINGIDGDTDNDGQGWEIGLLPDGGGIQEVFDLQIRYVEKMIDTLNDLDNIVWEIGNESRLISNDWQEAIIDRIKTYESTLPKQHLVWKTAMDDKGQNQYVNSKLFNSNADIISPNHRSVGDYRNDPPASSGAKIVMPDTDHLWGIGGDVSWVWKTFLRGNHPIFMDPHFGGPWLNLPPDIPKYEKLRNAMGHTLAYSERIDLASSVPQESGTAGPCSTGYCLFDRGQSYLAYQPESGSLIIDLPTGEYRTVEWFDPNAGTAVQKGQIKWEGGERTFVPPFDGPAVLLIHAHSSPRLHDPFDGGR